MLETIPQLQFGRYRLLQRIAVGGMAEVFVGAVQGVLGFEKRMVVKRMLPDLAKDPEFVRMFATEAKLVCHLVHPNIVQVHELGEAEGLYYIAMEYVHGIDGQQLWRSLSRRRQRLPVVLALFIVSELLKALDYAHRAVGPDRQLLGVVHRDVSPSNILISHRGDVKVTDFGVALVERPASAQAAMLKGKYAYMSPEQVAGLSVDHRSDIFAAGVVLAEFLLGRRLFSGRSDFETLDRVMNVRLDVLDQVEDKLPTRVRGILRRALQREASDRYPSAREFQDDISRYIHDRWITQDTLAAFLEQHVTPYLGTRAERADQGLEARDLTKTPAAVVPAPTLQQLAQASPTVAETDHDPYVPAAGEKEPAADAQRGWSIDWPLTSPDTFAPETRQAAHRKTREIEVDLDLDLDLTPAGELDPLIRLAASVDPEGSIAAKQPGAQSGSGISTADTASFREIDGPDSVHAAPIAPSSSSPTGSATQLLNARLRTVEVAALGTPPADYTGDLATRTLTKVLFRFAMAREDGLLIVHSSSASSTDPSQETDEVVSSLRRIHAKVTGRTPPPLPPERRRQIHLVAGRPHLIAADRTEESLVAHLIQHDGLDSHAVVTALRAHPGRGLVGALMAQKLLSPLNISRHVSTLVLAKVLEAFRWEAGQFAFYRRHPEPNDAFPTGLHALALIRRAVGEMPSAQLDQYFRRYEDRRMVPNPTPPCPIDAFHPDEVLLGAYRAVGSRRKLAALIAACEDWAPPVGVKQALYLLLECELARIE